MPETTTSSIPSAISVITEEAPRLRARFDAVFAAEIMLVYGALDFAMRESQRADALLPGMTDVQRQQQALCMALIRKSINDILGALDVFRAGYLDLSQGILRGVIEGFCTAILINKDSEIYRQYLKMEYSVNESVRNVARRQDLGLDTEATATLKSIYKKLHTVAHPTLFAIATQFPQEGAGFPIGGAYDPPKIGKYRDHCNQLRAMALNIAGFLRHCCCEGTT